ncbi:MAG: hypothetical protein ACPGSL_09925, partial [Vicingaceae bacterium]
MNSLKHTVLDQNLFEQQLLRYFKNAKNIVFLNSNNIEKTNLFAVSENNDLNEKENQFGFVSYDYKNKIEQLFSKHNDGIAFPDKHFFT